MLNQKENDNHFHNKLNLYVQNVYSHKMVEHNEHNKNAKNKKKPEIVEISVRSVKKQNKPQHAIVFQEH